MLLKERRLIFVNGGFGSPDEADNTFQPILANWMAGHEFIVKEFGQEYLPKTAW